METHEAIQVKNLCKTSPQIPPPRLQLSTTTLDNSNYGPWEYFLNCFWVFAPPLQNSGSPWGIQWLGLSQMFQPLKSAP